MKKYILFTFSLFLAFCTNPNSKVNNKDVFFSITIPWAERTLNISDYFDLEKIITLETNDQALLSELNNIIFYNDVIYILDIRSKAIFKFSDNGKFLSKYCNPGKGPDQYITISDFDIANDTIYLIDPLTESLQKLDLNFNVISTRKLPTRIQSIKKTNRGYIGFLGNSSTETSLKHAKDKYFNVIYLDENLNIVKNFLPFEKSYLGRLDRAGISSSFFVRNGKEILFYQPYNDTIISFNEEKETLENYCVVDFGKNKLKLNTLDHSRKEIRQVIKNNKKAHFIHDLYINDQFTIGKFIIDDIFHNFLSYHNGVHIGKLELDKKFNLNIQPLQAQLTNNRIVCSLSNNHLVHFLENEYESLTDDFKILKGNISISDNPVLIVLKWKER